MVGRCWLLEWKDQWSSSGDWIHLADLKNSYPIEVADYGSVNNKIASEAAFAWLWVQHAVPKKHKQFIQKAKTCFRRKCTHSKFGIKIPTSVQKACFGC